MLQSLAIGGRIINSRQIRFDILDGRFEPVQTIEHPLELVLQDDHLSVGNPERLRPLACFVGPLPM